VDIATLAFETGAEWVPRALAAHVDLGFARLDDPLNGRPLVVKGSAVLLREVIANLLDNALKYVPSARLDGANVTVTVSQAVDENGVKCAEIAIEDNGSGVPPGLQAELFKRFFRGDRHDGADAGVDAGAGLGLAIVRDIMSLHNGSVRYEDATGGGARFVLRIPLAGDLRNGADAGHATPPASAHAPLG